MKPESKDAPEDFKKVIITDAALLDNEEVNTIKPESKDAPEDFKKVVITDAALLDNEEVKTIEPENKIAIDDFKKVVITDAALLHNKEEHEKISDHIAMTKQFVELEQKLYQSSDINAPSAPMKEDLVETNIEQGWKKASIMDNLSAKIAGVKNYFKDKSNSSEEILSDATNNTSAGIENLIEDTDSKADTLEAAISEELINTKDEISSELNNVKHDIVQADIENDDKIETALKDGISDIKQNIDGVADKIEDNENTNNKSSIMGRISNKIASVKTSIKKQINLVEEKIANAADSANNGSAKIIENTENKIADIENTVAEDVQDTIESNAHDINDIKDNLAASKESVEHFGLTIKPNVPQIENLSVYPKAATKIQSYWRGHNSRQHSRQQQLKKLQEPAECDELPYQRGFDGDHTIKAATVIQAFIRGHLVRKQLKQGVNLKKNNNHLNVLHEEDDEVNQVDKINTLSDEDISHALLQLDALPIPNNDVNVHDRTKRSLDDTYPVKIMKPIVDEPEKVVVRGLTRTTTIDMKLNEAGDNATPDLTQEMEEDSEEISKALEDVFDDLKKMNHEYDSKKDNKSVQLSQDEISVDQSKPKNDAEVIDSLAITKAFMDNEQQNYQTDCQAKTDNLLETTTDDSLKDNVKKVSILGGITGAVAGVTNYLIDKSIATKDAISNAVDNAVEKHDNHERSSEALNMTSSLLENEKTDSTAVDDSVSDDVKKVSILGGITGAVAGATNYLIDKSIATKDAISNAVDNAVEKHDNVEGSSEALNMTSSLLENEETDSTAADDSVSDNVKKVSILGGITGAVAGATNYLIDKSIATKDAISNAVDNAVEKHDKVEGSSEALNMTSSLLENEETDSTTADDSVSDNVKKVSILGGITGAVAGAANYLKDKSIATKDAISNAVDNAVEKPDNDVDTSIETEKHVLDSLTMTRSFMENEQTNYLGSYNIKDTEDKVVDLKKKPSFLDSLNEKIAGVTTYFKEKDDAAKSAEIVQTKEEPIDDKQNNVVSEVKEDVNVEATKEIEANTDNLDKFDETIQKTNGVKVDEIETDNIIDVQQDFLSNEVNSYGKITPMSLDSKVDISQDDTSYEREISRESTNSVDSAATVVLNDNYDELDDIESDENTTIHKLGDNLVDESNVDALKEIKNNSIQDDLIINPTGFEGYENEDSRKSNLKFVFDVISAATKIQSMYRGYSVRNQSNKKPASIEDAIDIVENNNNNNIDSNIIVVNDDDMDKISDVIAKIEAEQNEELEKIIHSKFNSETDLNDLDDNESIEMVELKNQENIDLNVTLAALKIQKLFKGYKVRKQMKNFMKNTLEQSDEILSNNDGIDSQTLNLIMEKNSVADMVHAALVIQKAFKGYKVRKDLKNDKYIEAKASENEAILSNENNTSLLEMANAAIIIQKAFKGYKVKKNLNKQSIDSSIIENKDSNLNEIQNTAAISIQKTFKGYKTRKDLKSSKCVEAPGNNLFDMVNAAIVIQKTFKGYKVRKDLKNKEIVGEKLYGNKILDVANAAIVIQKAFKGYKVRKALKNVKKTNTDSVQENTAKSAKSQSENDAAVAIQKTFKGYKVRKDLKNDKLHSGEDQKFNAINSIEVTKDDKDSNFVDMANAAILIQKTFKGYKVRKDLNKDTIRNIKTKTPSDIVEGIQINDTKHDASTKNDLFDMVKAAVIIQKTFKGYIVRKKFHTQTNVLKSTEKTLLPKKEIIDSVDFSVRDNNAATTIQKVFKGHKVRKDLKNDKDNLFAMVNAAIVIQKAFKRYRVRNNLPNKIISKQSVDTEEGNKAATTIQKVFKGYKVRKGLRSIDANAPEMNVFELANAAIVIQKAFKGYKARKAYKALRYRNMEGQEEQGQLCSEPTDSSFDMNKLREEIRETAELIKKQEEEEQKTKIDFVNAADLTLAALKIKKALKQFNISKGIANDNNDDDLFNVFKGNMDSVGHSLQPEVLEDTNVWPFLSLEDLAAIRIQKMYKGHIVRKNIEAKRKSVQAPYDTYELPSWGKEHQKLLGTNEAIDEKQGSNIKDEITNDSDLNINDNISNIAEATMAAIKIQRYFKQYQKRKLNTLKNSASTGNFDILIIGDHDAENDENNHKKIYAIEDSNKFGDYTLSNLSEATLAAIKIQRYFKQYRTRNDIINNDANTNLINSNKQNNLIINACMPSISESIPVHSGVAEYIASLIDNTQEFQDALDIDKINVDRELDENNHLDNKNMVDCDIDGDKLITSEICKDVTKIDKILLQNSNESPKNVNNIETSVDSLNINDTDANSIHNINEINNIEIITEESQIGDNLVKDIETDKHIVEKNDKQVVDEMHIDNNVETIGNDSTIIEQLDNGITLKELACDESNVHQIDANLSKDQKEVLETNPQIGDSLIINVKIAENEDLSNETKIDNSEIGELGVVGSAAITGIGKLVLEKNRKTDKRDKENLEKLKAKSEEIEQKVKSSIEDLENLTNEIDSSNQLDQLDKHEPFYLHAQNTTHDNPIAAAIRVSSRNTNQEPSLGLLHSGEFHDATFPLSFSPTNIQVVVQDNRASSRNSRPPSMMLHSGEMHDGLIQQTDAATTGAPAGAATVTHPSAVSMGKRVEEVVVECTQASYDKDDSARSPAVAATTDSVPGMEEKRNNNAPKIVNSEKNMESQAATKIQASFRGYQVRKQMKPKNTDITSPRRSARRKSTGKIVDSNKPKDKRGPNDLEERSATKIQAGIRGFLVRRRNQKPKKNTPESS